MLDVQVEEWVGLYERGAQTWENMLWGDAKDSYEYETEYEIEQKRCLNFFRRVGREEELEDKVSSYRLWLQFIT